MARRARGLCAWAISAATPGAAPFSTRAERRRAHEALASPIRWRRVSPPLDLDHRLLLLREFIPGRIVFTTSFGIEDQLITHSIFTQGLDIDVVTLDTGRLFPETYELWEKTEARYARRIRAVYPQARAA